MSLFYLIPFFISFSVYLCHVDGCFKTNGYQNISSLLFGFFTSVSFFIYIQSYFSVFDFYFYFFSFLFLNLLIFYIMKKESLYFSSMVSSFSIPWFLTLCLFVRPDNQFMVSVFYYDFEFISFLLLLFFIYLYFSDKKISYFPIFSSIFLFHLISLKSSDIRGNGYFFSDLVERMDFVEQGFFSGIFLTSSLMILVYSIKKSSQFLASKFPAYEDFVKKFVKNEDFS